MCSRFAFFRLKRIFEQKFFWFPLTFASHHSFFLLAFCCWRHSFSRVDIVLSLNPFTIVAALLFHTNYEQSKCERGWGRVSEREREKGFAKQNENEYNANYVETYFTLIKTHHRTHIQMWLCCFKAQTENFWGMEKKSKWTTWHQIAKEGEEKNLPKNSIIETKHEIKWN